MSRNMSIPTTEPPILTELRYERAAEEYLRKLPLEHFMERVPHAKQREITLESLALVHARRPDVQVFSELLVQYPRPRKKKLGQVVPDNMVVIHSEPIDADGSYNLPLQPVGPFWILEYVSKSSTRKDYVDNFRMYEKELKVPYYLVFDPEKLKLTLYHYHSEKFVPLVPNDQGRLLIPELDLAVGLLDGWVRFWYEGKLLPLPGELQQALDRSTEELAVAQRRATTAERRADTAERELEKLRAQMKEQQGSGERPK